MGNSIFQNNTSLETVVFEDGNQPLAMGGWTFNGCSAIKEIVLPARLASFGANSNFNGCSSLTKVVFRGPSTLADLKAYTFEATALTEIDFSGLTEVETFNANILQKLTSAAVKVTLPQKMTKKPNEALASCNAEEIVFPEGVTEIAANALDGYTKVKKLSIPSTLTKLGNTAFKGCTSLSDVTFASNPTLNSSMNYCFEGCTALDEIDLSPLPGVKGLVATFKNSGLSHITFSPESKMTTFNWDLFNGTPLKSIDCPATLTKIGARAFLNCGNLKTVRIPKGVTEILADAFSHDADKKGVDIVVFDQQSGNWPAAVENGAAVNILASDTKAYCYKDVTGVPEGVTTVATMQAAPYSTYFSSTPVALPDGVTAGVVSGIDNGKLILDFDKYVSGKIIPASTAVLLKSGLSSTTLYPVIEPEDNSVFDGTNYLSGTEDNSTVDAGGKICYALTEKDGKYSFDKTEGQLENVANHAYLALPSAIAGSYSSFPVSDTTTGIMDIISDESVSDTPVYNLQGIRVDINKLTPGIYISNGRKFIVK